MRRIAILGSTGSIGTQALDVAARHSDRFEVTALAAHSSSEKLFEQVRAFRPKIAALTVEPESIPEDVKNACQWMFGEDVLTRVVRACDADDVLVSVVGVVGLAAVMEALSCGKRVLLANKEPLVAGGELVTEAARRAGHPLLPVDSEHSAIFQCLQGAGGNRPERLILTASGGPFRTWKKEDIACATKEQALRHPNWVMGAKLTIDSSTLMNKGLEVIEASWLFQKPVDDIEVVVHRESVIHSMVEFVDGSCIAQLGVPDMQIPIQYAMTYPDRKPSAVKPLSLADYGKLTFYRPDTDTFSCLRVCMDAARMGGLYPCAANAANEEAVALFRAEKIRFLQIGELVEQAAFAQRMPLDYTLEDVFWAEKEARRFVREHCG